MFFKFLVVLVCLGLAQAQTEEIPSETAETDEPQTEEAETEELQTSPPSSSQAPNTCDQQVLELLGQIENAANQAREETSSAAASLDGNIAASSNEVKQLLENLNSKARQGANEKAEKCKAELEAALSETNEGALISCNEAQSLNIQFQADQINNLKGEAGQICNICGQEVEQNDCVKSNVDNITERLKGAQSEISGQVKNIQSEAEECAQNAKADASNTINSASTNLDACLQSP